MYATEYSLNQEARFSGECWVKLPLNGLVSISYGLVAHTTRWTRAAASSDCVMDTDPVTLVMRIVVEVGVAVALLAHFGARV